MTTADNNHNDMHARILGDVIVINAEGMSREQVKRLARNCVGCMRDMVAIEGVSKRTSTTTTNNYHP